MLVYCVGVPCCCTVLVYCVAVLCWCHDINYVSQLQKNAQREVIFLIVFFKVHGNGSVKRFCLQRWKGNVEGLCLMEKEV